MGLPLAARGIVFIVAHSETNSLPVMMMVIFERGCFCNRVKINELPHTVTFQLTGVNGLTCASRLQIAGAIPFACLHNTD